MSGQRSGVGVCVVTGPLRHSIVVRLWRLIAIRRHRAKSDELDRLLIDEPGFRDIRPPTVKFDEDGEGAEGDDDVGLRGAQFGRHRERDFVKPLAVLQIRGKEVRVGYECVLNIE